MLPVKQNIDTSLRSETNNVIRASFSYSRRIHALKDDVEREVTGRKIMSRQMEVLVTRSETLRLNNESLHATHKHDRTRIENLESKLNETKSVVSQLQMERDHLMEEYADLTELHLELRKNSVELQECLVHQKEEVNRLAGSAYNLQHQNISAHEKIQKLEDENLSLAINHSRLQRRYAQATSVKAAMELIRESAYKSFREACHIANNAPTIAYELFKEWRITSRFKEWNDMGNGFPTQSGLYLVSDGKRCVRCYFDRKTYEFSCGDMGVRFWTDNSQEPSV